MFSSCLKLFLDASVSREMYASVKKNIRYLYWHLWLPWICCLLLTNVFIPMHRFQLFYLYILHVIRWICDFTLERADWSAWHGECKGDWSSTSTVRSLIEGNGGEVWGGLVGWFSSSSEGNQEGSYLTWKMLRIWGLILKSSPSQIEAYDFPKKNLGQFLIFKSVEKIRKILRQGMKLS